MSYRPYSEIPYSEAIEWDQKKKSHLHIFKNIILACSMFNLVLEFCVCIRRMFIIFYIKSSPVAILEHWHVVNDL